MRKGEMSKEIQHTFRVLKKKFSKREWFIEVIRLSDFEEDVLEELKKRNQGA